MLSVLVRRVSAVAAVMLVTASLHAQGLVLSAPPVISVSSVNSGFPVIIGIAGGFPNGPGIFGLSLNGPGPGGNVACGQILLTPPIFTFPISFTNQGFAIIPVTQLPTSLVNLPLDIDLQALAFFPTTCQVSNGAHIQIVP